MRKVFVRLFGGESDNEIWNNRISLSISAPDNVTKGAHRVSAAPTVRI